MNRIGDTMLVAFLSRYASIPQKISRLTTLISFTSSFLSSYHDFPLFLPTLLYSLPTMHLLATTLVCFVLSFASLTTAQISPRSFIPVSISLLR